MNDDQQVSPKATKGESEEAQRTTPKIFMVAMGVMVLAAIAVMAVGAKFIFH